MTLLIALYKKLYIIYIIIIISDVIVVVLAFSSSSSSRELNQLKGQFHLCNSCIRCSLDVCALYFKVVIND